MSGFAAADTLTHLGASVTVLAERADDRPAGAGGPAGGAGRDGAHRPRRHRLAARRAWTWWSPRPASRRPPRSSWRRAGGASRCGARSSWPGGCGTRSTPARGWPSPAPTARPRPCRCSTPILRAGGLRSVACGNVGLPIVEAVMDPAAVRGLRRRAVQLPAALHLVDVGARRRRAQRRRGPPGLVRRADRWPTTPPTRAGSTTGCGRPASTTSPTRSPSGWSATPTSWRAPGRSGFTLGTPGLGMVGLVEDVLADRAFVEDREHTAAELCTIGDLASAGAALRGQRPGGGGPGPLRGGAAGRRPRRAALVRPRRPPDRRPRPGGRGALRRRLQGHQPARRRLLAARLRAGGLGRRRPGQGRLVRRAGRPPWARGCGASCSSDGTAR